MSMTLDPTIVPVVAAPEGHSYRRITVDRVAGACGAEIGGVDCARELDDETVAEIRRAALDHQVLFFRGQSLSAAEQVAFSRRFGAASPVPFVEPLADHPEVIAVVREASELQGYNFGGLWHSDFSFLAEPPSFSLLHAVEVPSYGGDTVWANQYLAYESLSKSMRRILGDVIGVHSAVTAYSPKMQAFHDTFVGMRVQTSSEAERRQLHPAVRTHGETGRQALYLNPQYTVGLDGFGFGEANALFGFLWTHTVQVGYTCRWRWAAGDVAMWDNRCVQHMAMNDYSGQRRQMHRTTCAGEAPLR